MSFHHSMHYTLFRCCRGCCLQREIYPDCSIAARRMRSGCIQGLRALQRREGTYSRLMSTMTEDRRTKRITGENRRMAIKRQRERQLHRTQIQSTRRFTSVAELIATIQGTQQTSILTLPFIRFTLQLDPSGDPSGCIVWL